MNLRNLKFIFSSIGMRTPQMIACGLSLPHRSRMGRTGLKYGRKIMKMVGSGAYKKDMMMGGAMQPAVMRPAVMPARTLKFR